MPGGWGADWKIARNQLEAKTGQKKPSEKSRVGIGQGTGLEDALKACDADWTAIEVANGTAAKLAAVKKFEADIKVFDTKMAAYEGIGGRGRQGAGVYRQDFDDQGRRRSRPGKACWGQGESQQRAEGLQ
jgi:hypothetical protein